MKIAVFYELTPLSGARKVVDEYGKILKKNHTVDLYYVDEKIDPKVKDIFSKVNYFKFVSSKSRIFRDSIELVKLYVLHRKIAQVINNNYYDVVFVSPSRFTQAPFILRFIKNPVYFCQEPLRIVYDPLMKIPSKLNFVKKSYEVINRRVRKVIDKGNILRAHLVLANSEFSRENIHNAYGINAKVCYLGVDVNKFKPLNINKVYDLLFIGIKEGIEGYDLISKTLSLYQEPPQMRVISRKPDDRGISEAELINEINKSKIVLALSRSEPFGLVPIEAMACGVPVIAVSEGGFKESVVDNKTGYLINREKQQLKEKIDLLLKNDSLRNRLGKNSRERILTKFTWEISANNFLKLIKNKTSFSY
jgi:glycosyltransferase involved in cell wall biosynthesis